MRAAAVGPSRVALCTAAVHRRMDRAFSVEWVTAAVILLSTVLTCRTECPHGISPRLSRCLCLPCAFVHRLTSSSVSFSHLSSYRRSASSLPRSLRFQHDALLMMSDHSAHRRRFRHRHLQQRSAATSNRRHRMCNAGRQLQRSHINM
jgi:hypothetical protein